MWRQQPPHYQPQNRAKIKPEKKCTAMRGFLDVAREVVYIYIHKAGSHDDGQ